VSGPARPAAASAPASAAPAQAVGARAGQQPAWASRIDADEVARRVYQLMMADLRLELARRGESSR
jgi:type IV secretory pathway TrbL component